MSSTLDVIDDWLEKAERARYGVSELAEECRVSRRQLRRYFHERCGISPRNWLNQVRMWKSLSRLLETGHVSGVADTLSFERSATFSDLFRKQYGCSPREFMVNPEKILERMITKNPGLLETDGSIPVDELSKLAASTVEFVRRRGNQVTRLKRPENVKMSEKRKKFHLR